MTRPLVFILAACLAAPALAAGDSASGRAKSQTCAACHGADGNAPTGPDFPRLAGQHYDYLLKAMRDYKSGERKDPIMGGQVGSLTQQDMADLAAYFSSQKGSLKVIR
jgi:cytochrome c553